jgi:hypothetical protein
VRVVDRYEQRVLSRRRYAVRDFEAACLEAIADSRRPTLVAGN